MMREIESQPAPEISLVSPMFNEGEQIEQNLRALRSALDSLGRSWEIVLVNDGSTDSSYECAMRAAKDDPRIRLISYRTNRGRGYAIRRGLERARGEIVVVTESDLSWGAEIIERMVRALEEQEADAVIASPHMAGGRLLNVPATRARLSKFGNILLRRLMPGGHTMNTGMTRAYRRYVIEALDLESDSKELHLEIIAKLYAMGFRAVEVPATVSWPRERARRQSSFRAWPFIKSHLISGFAQGPLLVFGTLGLVEIALGSIIGFYLLALSLSGTPVGGRPLLLLSVLLILMGILVLVFSFVALQVRDLRRSTMRLQGTLARLMHELGRKPRERIASPPSTGANQDGGEARPEAGPDDA